MADPSKLLWLTRFRQFSLRTGAILFLTLAIAFGLVGRWVQDVRQRCEGQQRLVNRCQPDAQKGRILWVVSRVSYAPEAKVDRFTAFVRRWVHSEYNRKFDSVHLSTEILSETPPIDLSLLFGARDVTMEIFTTDVEAAWQALQIPSVEKIRIKFNASRKRSSGADKKLNWRLASQARKLTTLEFDSDAPFDELCGELGNLPNLKDLTMDCTPEGFAHLAKSRSLKYLKLYLDRTGDLTLPISDAEQLQANAALRKAFDEWAKRDQLLTLEIHGRLPVTPDALESFCKTSPIVDLELHNTEISPECLATIAKLGKLQKLRIFDESLRDEDLACLEYAKKLESLTVRPNISRDAMINLKEKLPNCQMNEKWHAAIPKASK